MFARTHHRRPLNIGVIAAERATNGVGLADRVDMWRASIDALTAFGGYTSWDSAGHPRHVLTTASTEEVDHARRVLDRLATASEHHPDVEQEPAHA